PRSVRRTRPSSHGIAGTPPRGSRGRARPRRRRGGWTRDGCRAPVPMTLWLDPDAAADTARAWLAHADHLHRVGCEVERLLVELALDEHTAASQHLTAAATELWLAAALTQRTVAAV